MRILAVDCSAGPASCAVVSFADSYEVLAHAFKNEGLTHSQTLVPMIDEVLKTSKLKLKDIDFFAINAGPGSFTGVRIGVAALKGLTLGDEANCIPVSTLRSMAYNYADTPGTTVCSVMDARCSQVYTATFEVGDGYIARKTEDSAMMISELEESLKSLKKDVIFVGDGAVLCYNILNGKLPCALAGEGRLYQDAVSVALCAADMLQEGFRPIPSKELLPVYLRAPQAERELKRRNSQ